MRLNRGIEKRVESGNFRVCAAHDLAKSSSRQGQHGLNLPDRKNRLGLGTKQCLVNPVRQEEKRQEIFRVQLIRHVTRSAQEPLLNIVDYAEFESKQSSWLSLESLNKDKRTS